MPITIKDNGKDNVVVGEANIVGNLLVEFRGNNSRLEFGDDVGIVGDTRIIFSHSDQICRFHGKNRFRGEVQLKRFGNVFEFGKGSTTNASVWAHLGEPNDRIEIGEDCLLATVRFRTSDSHTIFDLETGARLNPSASIRIERKVWLAEEVLCLKGAHVGEGSIVGTRSMVNGPLPPNSLCVGSPARVVRSGVGWRP